MPAIRPAHSSLLVKVFERDGFTFAPQRGDQLIYTKSGVARPLVIPAYDEVPVFVIKNLLRTAGMNRGRSFGLLMHLLELWRFGVFWDAFFQAVRGLERTCIMFGKPIAPGEAPWPGFSTGKLSTEKEDCRA